MLDCGWKTCRGLFILLEYIRWTVADMKLPFMFKMTVLLIRGLIVSCTFPCFLSGLTKVSTMSTDRIISLIGIQHWNHKNLRFSTIYITYMLFFFKGRLYSELCNVPPMGCTKQRKLSTGRSGRKRVGLTFKTDFQVENSSLSYTSYDAEFSVSLLLGLANY